MATKFSMVAYTGQVIEAGWWGRVIFDVSGMTTAKKLPALREHARDRSVGVIDSTSKDHRTLKASGYFVDTRDGREVQQLIKEGYPYQASVGINFAGVEELKAGAKATVNGMSVEGPMIIVRQSHVREISFVSLGADDRTSVDIAATLPLCERARADRHRASSMPENFDAAVLQMLRAGHDPRQSVEAAAQTWPHLFEQYKRELCGMTDE